MRLLAITLSLIMLLMLVYFIGGVDYREEKASFIGFTFMIITMVLDVAVMICK